MNAVIYARYSSDNQREESIEGQMRECKEYAQQKGITILSSYIDRALSARTDKRPEFQRMIKDSEKGLFDIILVWKLDRFARNRYDSARYKALLKKHGVQVVSAMESISDGPEGVMLEAVLEGYAEYYSAELAQKVNRGMHENALKGKSNGGGIPLGFRLGKEHKLEINPETAPIVLEIYQRYAGGELAKDIIADLNRRGIRNNYGKKFSKSYVSRLLSNRKYLGEYRYKDVVIPGGLPEIIPQALFDEVQVRMSKNKRAPARAKAKCEYLLSGKLICGECGKLMVGESGVSKTGLVHNYYKCVGVKKKLGCHKKSLRKQWIEDVVIYYTVRDVLTDERLKALAGALAKLQKEEDSMLPTLRRQLAEVEKGIENMVDAIQQGIFTQSTKQRLTELEERKAELEVSIMQAEITHPEYSEMDIYLWLSHFKGGDATDTAYRRKLIDTFVNAVYCYEEHIVIIYNFHDGNRETTLEEINRVINSDFGAVAAPVMIDECSQTRNPVRCYLTGLFVVT